MGSWTVIIQIDSHLILALDSKSVQCVCDILYDCSIFISVFTGCLNRFNIYILGTSLSFAYVASFFNVRCYTGGH